MGWRARRWPAGNSSLFLHFNWFDWVLERRAGFEIETASRRQGETALQQFDSFYWFHWFNWLTACSASEELKRRIGEWARRRKTVLIGCLGYVLRVTCCELVTEVFCNGQRTMDNGPVFYLGIGPYFEL
jgi:hypothetical protein